MIIFVLKAKAPRIYIISFFNKGHSVNESHFMYLNNINNRKYVFGKKFHEASSNIPWWMNSEQMVPTINVPNSLYCRQKTDAAIVSDVIID